ncbi:MAG: EAL domain-containing protein [Alphaproteobacteria bacterium]|nr:EAL domain-containing protein [Alphaproteobacteria bacterium]
MLHHSFRLNASDIDRAFEAGHFFVIFQPKAEIPRGRIVGVETFVRWRHPTFGLMPPGLFLNFVESRGRMRELTELVLTLACRAARDFRAAGRDWHVSLNMSASDLKDPRLPQLIQTLAGLQNVPPSVLTLEIPASSVPEPGSAVDRHLRAIAALGCRLALDTGASLAPTPHPIPPDLFSEIKIGGATIIRFAQMAKATGTSALAAKLKAARTIGLSAVAVGVEDDETFSALRDIGFTAAQGSFIRRATTLRQLLNWDGTWERGAAPQTAAAEIDMLAAPEEIVGANAVRARGHGDPQSAADLLAAVEAGAAVPLTHGDDSEPLDLDEDDESDVFDAEFEGLGQEELIEEEPEGEPEIGSANEAPPLTAEMIGRPLNGKQHGFAAAPALADAPRPTAPAPEAPRVIERQRPLAVISPPRLEPERPAGPLRRIFGRAKPKS